MFERDKFTCVWCGQIGGSLNADHIKPFFDYPELRLDISNGRTLCVPCHRLTDTFMSKALRGKRFQKPKMAFAGALAAEVSSVDQVIKLLENA